KYSTSLYSSKIRPPTKIYTLSLHDALPILAHRGGVVDMHTDENSRASIEKAATDGYYMVELDVRMTRDSVLIVHHDRNMQRFFRSEEHTSELQSRENLVCRLLLEKKKEQ